MAGGSHSDRVVHGGDASAVARELGVRPPSCVRLDFSVNVNPLGAPGWIKGVLANAEAIIERYPDAYASAVTAALADAHGVEARSVVPGNGSTEILGWIMTALRPRLAAWCAPAYGGYKEACVAAGVEGKAVPSLRRDGRFIPDWPALARGGFDLVFVATPNNPTGGVLDSASILEAAESDPRRTIVVDESFMDFLPDAGARTLIRPAMPPNLIVIKSLTKFFAIPGIRLGMACAAPGTIETIAAVRLPWSVNGVAQAVGQRLYADREYVQRSRAAIPPWQAALATDLAAIPGVSVYPSEAPFLLCGLPPDWPAPRLQAELLQRGILIRSCSNFDGLGDAYCRLAVRPRAEQEDLLAALREVLEGRAAGAPRRRKPAVMVVGTTSHAGKSVVAAGLCRVLARRGWRVAPFKAQNMALNSFVTAEGGEMGRAQVTQARAARVEPHTDMNPVLLKPIGVAGSQVIVNGKAIGNMSAVEYYRHKTELRAVARAAYDRLAARADVVVLEGAGSPAEINLREHDFVNLDMAEHAGAAAILVADIDRGGVFASVFGTIALLTPAQRRLVRGVLINKFRGDPSLLTPGLREIEDLTGVPVLGVLPYVSDLRIEEEDSLGIEGRASGGWGFVDIAVVRLPRISNYTDFLALERRPGVRVRYVTRPREMQGADLVILPGSKNTRADLQYLHDNGFSARLQTLHESGMPVFGICGGYQMLGRRVADPLGVEGEPGETPGLGLLPVETTLEAEKELAQVAGVTTPACVFAAPGTAFRGYEIHAGRTTGDGEAGSPLLILSRRAGACEEQAGAAAANGQGCVFGSYVHGLFDDDAMSGQLVAWLCRRKGVDPHVLEHEAPADPDAALDKLADMLEANMDMKTLEGWLRASA